MFAAFWLDRLDVVRDSGLARREVEQQGMNEDEVSGMKEQRTQRQQRGDADKSAEQQVRLSEQAASVPGGLLQLQRTLGNRAFGRWLGGTLVQRGSKPGKEAESPADKLPPVDPDLNIICWRSVGKYKYFQGDFTREQYEQFEWGYKDGSDAAKAMLVNDGDTEVTDPGSIPDGAAVGLYRAKASSDGYTLAHVMVAKGGGICLGSNNGCIGGTANWSEYDLGKQFDWKSGQPTLQIGDFTQKWKIYYRL
uniref:Uncharacterized protein n=1 Tax=Paenibacillus athensensis TaxID=1967502 RepID=A0A4Y8Q9N4_9BACL